MRLLSEILSIPTLGVRDNLLDRGLHSLLATRVVKEIHDTLQVELPLRALFESPTVEALARFVDGGVEAVFGPPPEILKADAELDPGIRPGGD